MHCSSTYDVVADIVAVTSLLIKMEREDIIEKRDTYIAFLNELGVKNENGGKLNPSNFKKMMLGLSQNEKTKLVEEFNSGFESIYRSIEMYNTNKFI